MKYRLTSIVVVLLLLSSCATVSQRSRLMWGGAIGGASGAIGGAVLSPNDESRGLNALVFGISGVLIGTLAALFTGQSSEPQTVKPSLKEKETGAKLESSVREFAVPVNANLPSFVRDRIQPAVVEEFTETDTVSEDGSLHEPHKVYRIKRPAELFAKPTGTSTEGAAK